jgi:DNA (cytosine-5)-methyltransferase 1
MGWRISTSAGGGGCSLPRIAHCLNAGGMNRQDFETETLIPTGGYFDVAHSLRGEGFDASEDGTGRGTPLVPCVAPTLDQRAGRSGANSFATSGGLVPVHAFDARQSDVLQYGNKTGPLDTHGHSVAVAFTQNQRDEVRLLDVVGALSAEPGAKQQTYLKDAMQVRRLTPRECERLQGFPDDYTDIKPGGKPTPDGPRYKALGNSMAVPVMRWIGERINAVEKIE